MSGVNKYGQLKAPFATMDDYNHCKYKGKNKLKPLMAPIFPTFQTKAISIASSDYNYHRAKFTQKEESQPRQMNGQLESMINLYNGTCAHNNYSLEEEIKIETEKIEKRKRKERRIKQKRLEILNIRSGIKEELEEFQKNDLTKHSTLSLKKRNQIKLKPL
jgi:hypothetical protein